MVECIILCKSYFDYSHLELSPVSHQFASKLWTKYTLYIVYKNNDIGLKQCGHANNGLATQFCGYTGIVEVAIATLSRQWSKS